MYADIYIVSYSKPTLAIIISSRDRYLAGSQNYAVTLRSLLITSVKIKNIQFYFNAHLNSILRGYKIIKKHIDCSCYGRKYVSK